MILNMSAIKKVCLNSSKNYYTGTEMSPLHYGLSAEGYDINSIMEGYDKELWIVDVKNNKKVWYKNDQLSRITHEEPVIKNILSIYNNAEEIEKINQLKQKCGKDGSYNLKDIKKLYNICDENSNDPDCGDDDCKTDTSVAYDEPNGDTSQMSTASVATAATVATLTVDELTIMNVCNSGKTGDILKSAKGTRKDIKGVVNDDNKKPTDYNIFVKFRLTELKEISANKKDNFENVKIEWRELKKNKTALKLVMDKAYLWLNLGK